MKSKGKLARERSERSERIGRLGEPKTKVQPNPTKVLWCLVCEWRHSDSFTGRRRLGNHIANEHYDEVAFPQGVEPPDLVGP